MIEAANQMTTHEDIVKSVFIDPIRTVLVIDDEFPTLDNLIAKAQGEEGVFTAGAAEIKQVRQILDFARSKERPWLVDVHDGRKVSSAAEKGIVPYLHHSDLMVLDFHLEGDHKDGSAAIEILKKLAANDHFNLVILYTKGDAEGAILDVLRQVSLGLSYRDLKWDLSADELKSVKDGVEQWNEVDDTISETISRAVDDFLYLKTLSRGAPKLSSIFGTPEGLVLAELFKTKPKDVTLDREGLLKYLFNEKCRNLHDQLSAIDLGQIRIGDAEDCCWISTEKLFVTILSKGKCAPDQFENKLKAAISSSYPSPHRFLITKMRAEIDERGLVAEASILRDKQVQVAWLNDFLNPNPADVMSVVSATITRHWEAMGDHLRGGLQNFGDTLRSHYQGVDISTVMNQCGLQHASLKDTETLKRYNCFISTKPVDRSHLTTGHTFRIRHADAAGERTEDWICLSPACDMVPEQKTEGWNKRLGTSIPFIAVRLFSASDDSAVTNATRNTFLFLDIKSSIETFSIYPEGSVVNNPEWEQMFVSNHGRFHEGNKLTLTSIRGEGNAINSIGFEAEITAQLRTEYALNLLQRMGSQLSRPGLGMHFKSRSRAA
jgi:hypothetical protein